ncbi:uncharacterized protein LOC126295137 [Schistocerca gregaria]|uniref:uncharacterized protein LOC126295137 n=1 Tax=Schistocerca gregaria TaxID=7010 RepID=UPI00211F3E91|nr:uncharacterized protein LOC126295137 [Schistocerca gregaria]
MAMPSLSLDGNVPDDILFSIFSFLPIPDLVRCATVCRRWRRIVSEYSHVWKGKRYVSNRSPRESTEVCAVLCIVPLLQELDVKVTKMFEVKIIYPQLFLSVTNVCDLRAVRDCQRVGCTYLSTDLNVAEVIFSSQSLIDFTALRKLQIVGGNPTLTPFKPDTRAECAVGSALELCPNLRELNINVEALSGDYVDCLEGVSRLQTLRINCRGLEELTFLRHCSDALEELELESCDDLPPAAYSELRHLGNVKKLRLCDCRAEGEALEVAAGGLRSLVSLQLDRCRLLSDLSFLRLCNQLRELRVEAKDGPPTGLQCLPAGVRSLCLVDNAATADELSDVLQRLSLREELKLCKVELAHLGFLRHCPRLHRLYLENSTWPDTSVLSSLCHLTRLETLVLRRCRVDADVLSQTVSSLPQLHTLSLAYVEDVTHLRFLRHCPQLHTLSLFCVFGLDSNAYWELCHLNNLEQLCVSVLVRDVVSDIIRPCLPRVKIYCSEQFI